MNDKSMITQNKIIKNINDNWKLLP